MEPVSEEARSKTRLHSLKSSRLIRAPTRSPFSRISCANSFLACFLPHPQLVVGDGIYGTGYP
jgi:hypothetical protein